MYKYNQDRHFYIQLEGNISFKDTDKLFFNLVFQNSYISLIKDKQGVQHDEKSYWITLSPATEYVSKAITFESVLYEIEPKPIEVLSFSSERRFSHFYNLAN